MTSHLDDGTIQELLDGEIPSTALGPLQAHLASCGACRVRLDAARTMACESEELLEFLDEPIAPTVAPSVVAPLPLARPRSWVRTLAWAASIAVAVGAGWYARGDVQQVLPAPTTAAPKAEDAMAVATPPATPVITGTADTRPTAPVIANTAGTQSTAPSKATTPAVTNPDQFAEAAKVARADASERRERTSVAEETITPRVTSPTAPLNTVTTTRDAAPPPAASVGMGGGLDVRRAARTVGSARSEVSGLMPRDQLTTRQLIDASGSSDTLAIRIVALRTLLESFGPSLPTEIAVVCVAFSESARVGQSPIEVHGARDLPDSVLVMIAPAPRWVRSSSACTMAEVAPMPTVEAKTGRPAVMLLVGGVQFNGSDRATVGLQHRFHGRGAGGHRCALERRNGVWVVVECTGTWVA